MSVTSAEFKYLNQKKNPATATILSFFICGAGQLYNGQTGKGIAFFVTSVVCIAASGLIFPLIIVFCLWIFGMLDANAVAVDFNMRLKAELDAESKQADAQKMKEQEIAATTISSKEFVAQLEKHLNLFKNALLTESEFQERKAALIDILAVKKLREEPEDFLTEIIPLVRREALDNSDIAKIKSIVFGVAAQA